MCNPMDDSLIRHVYLTDAVNKETDKGFADFIVRSVNRFARHDWGNVPVGMRAENYAALESGDEVYGMYSFTDSPTILIVSDADRKATTVMFDYEY